MHLPQRFGKVPEPRLAGALAGLRQLLRATLGEDDLADTMDEHTFGAAQTAVLLALVHDAHMSVQAVDNLTTRAESQAQAFFERQERR